MDLTTTYMGLKLKSPLVVGASAPLTESLDNIKRIEDAGGAAIVLYSLFQEQFPPEKFHLEHNLNCGRKNLAKAISCFPQEKFFHFGAEEYLNHIRQAKEMIEIPIIASLNGCDLGGWVHYSKQLEQAGADAIELNIYQVPTDFNQTGAEIEQNYLEILKAVKADVNIPVALKISPFFANMANTAKQFADAGADALVLFNRFYQPDIDLEKLQVTPHLLLSQPQAMRLPLRWIAILYGRINTDFAATSGISHGTDVIKMMMVGAKVTMIVSALLYHGIQYLMNIETEIRDWLEEHEYESIQQIQGIISQLNYPEQSAFERAQYIRTLQTYSPTWAKNIPVKV